MGKGGGGEAFNRGLTVLFKTGHLITMYYNFSENTLYIVSIQL